MKFFGIENTDQIDLARLIKQLPRQSVWNPLSTQAQYITAILQSYPMFVEHDIKTPLRLAHFLGQGIVETGFLSAKSENLNYRFETLKKLFGHKFADDDEIKAYAGKPEKIANRIYADRMGNGPEASGDGWKYRGRGFFQLTGKDNYRRYGELAGVDLVADPDVLVRDLKRSLQVAAAYFQKTGLIAFADQNDVAKVSRGVNRGNPQSSKPAFHEAERIEWTTKAVALVQNPTTILREGEPAPDPAPVPVSNVLKNGSVGGAVATLQRTLAQLGYSVGEADGVFGPGTHRAVVNFQQEHGLPATGEVDDATQAAIRAALDEKPADPGVVSSTPKKPQSSEPQAKPPEKPIAQSRTLWGAILAAIVGAIEFLRQGVVAVRGWFPTLDTPIGRIETFWILAVLLFVGIAIVIYARLDDRAKRKR